MKVYLSGPMRGLPELNCPAFHAAAAKLRAEGHTVFNPAELDDTTDRGALTKALAWICTEAEAIALLPGWEDSRGACAEYWTARALDLEIWRLTDI